MIRRLLDLLQRQPAAPPYRPNELRRDIARAERLRREALHEELAARQPPPAPRESQTRQEPPPAPQAAERRAALDALGLRSRADVRRAFLLKEILEPPLALRNPGERRVMGG